MGIILTCKGLLLGRVNCLTVQLSNKIDGAQTNFGSGWQNPPPPHSRYIKIPPTTRVKNLIVLSLASQEQSRNFLVKLSQLKLPTFL